MYATTSSQQQSLRAAFHGLRVKTAIRVHLLFTFVQLWFRPRTFVSAKRRFLLRQLLRYAVAGRYPRNYHYAYATPIFRDTAGTLCAMGYLASQDGQTELVSDIVATDNLIDLSQRQSAAMNSWLKTVDVTPEEAAMIQPGYDFEQPPQQAAGLPDWAIVLAFALIILPLYISSIATYFLVGKRLLMGRGNMAKLHHLVGVLMILALVVGSVLLGLWAFQEYAGSKSTNYGSPYLGGPYLQN